MWLQALAQAGTAAPTWDTLVSLSPWAAAAAVAWSPLGKGVSAWLQGLGNGGGAGHDKLAAAMDRLASTQERQAETQEHQTRVLQQMQTALALLLDRTPRGD